MTPRITPRARTARMLRPRRVRRRMTSRVIRVAAPTRFRIHAAIVGLARVKRWTTSAAPSWAENALATTRPAAEKRAPAGESREMPAALAASGRNGAFHRCLDGPACGEERLTAAGMGHLPGAIAEHG